MPEDKEQQIWKFVSPAEFSLPFEPVIKKAHSFFAFSLRWFERPKDKQDREISSRLVKVPMALIEKVVPSLDYKVPAAEICANLGSWLETTVPDSYFRVFVAPYGGAIGSILTVTAQNNHFLILDPPSYEDLIGNNFSWMDKLSASAPEPIVVPQLEKFFLRHSNGLEHLRRLLAKLHQNKQKCIFGCNSWLWQYLESAMQLRGSFGRCYFLQSMSGANLQTLFAVQSQHSGENFVFSRQPDNGAINLLQLSASECIEFSSSQNGKNKENSTDVITDFFNKLAVDSRGIPLVAWAIYRSSFKVPDEQENKDETPKQRPVALLERSTAIMIPRLPLPVTQKIAFLLVFLLQHDGLTLDAIAEILIMDKAQILGLLGLLKESETIFAENDVWKINWQSYPAVRSFLAENDFLLDAM